MLSLRVEIALCLVAASLLGLLCGSMMQRARARRRLDESIEHWEARYAELERSARQDEENLEEQLQTLGQKLRTIEAENRSLREASDGEKESLDAARAEAIELNRRQTETQERLQHIIRERDREIAMLRARPETPGSGATRAAPESARVTGAARATATDDDATVALFGGEDRSTEHDELMVMDGFDETIRLDPSTLPHRRSADARVRTEAPRESAADGTPEADEATIALDEETLAMVRARGERGG